MHDEMQLVAHRITFHCQATTAIALPRYPGAAVRGALLGALRHQVCALHGASRAGGMERADGCPVCAFVAPSDEASERGRDVVRLFTVEPPIDAAGLHPAGWHFCFGLTLWGPAAALFPYLAVSAQVMGQFGFGRRADAPGRFQVLECRAHDLTPASSEQIMKAGSARLAQPPLPIDHDMVLARANALLVVGAVGETCRLPMRLLTPVRLITDGRLCSTLGFPILLRRVLRRLSDLSEAIGAVVPVEEFQSLIPLAPSVRIAEDGTTWVDLTSFSKRANRTTPIGGLVGRIVFEGDLAPFLPWLVWGEVAHVGKDTTKGNGWYRLMPPD